MPMSLQLDGVNFGFQPIRDDDGSLMQMILLFRDPSGVGQVVVPFAAEAWVNFKRQVAADGEVSPIALARSLDGVRRMDIPKGA
jgi:hypothetical protein